jgi:hypothetical protein
MAWQNVGPLVFLDPGQSVTWEYAFAGGADHGLQLAGPDLSPAPALLGTVVVSNQGIRINGFNNVTYVLTTTEVTSDEGAAFNLQGGGVA